MNKEKSVDDMNFEEALKELEQIVKTVDSGEKSLEDVIKAFERGSTLKMHCEKKLKEAKMRIEKIVKEDDNITSVNVEL